MELVTLQAAQAQLAEAKKNGALAISIDDALSMAGKAIAEAGRTNPEPLPGLKILGDGSPTDLSASDVFIGLGIESQMKALAYSDNENDRKKFKRFVAQYGATKKAKGSNMSPEALACAKQFFPALQVKDATTTGVSTGTGLTPYSLESPGLNVFPVFSPIVDETPRRTVGGTTDRWKLITGIKRGSFGPTPEFATGVSGRAPSMTFTEVDKGGLTFTKLGIEDYLTTEAQYGAKSTIDGANFDTEDLVRIGLLGGVRLMEEDNILGANKTALGAPTGLVHDATGDGASGAGSLTASTQYFFKVSAVTYSGYRFYSATGRTGGVDANGETTPSSEASPTTAASGIGSKTIGLKWNAVVAAVAYNVYGSATTGTESYMATVTINKYSVTTLTPTGYSANTPNVADKSADALAYDGMIPLFAKQGGYSISLDGAALTSDGTTNVAEFDTAFKYFYDVYRLSPDVIRVSSDQKRTIDKVVFGSSAPVYRLQLTGGSGDNIAGVAVAGVYNRYFNRVVPVEVHPTLPSGTILFQTRQLGKYYPYARLGQAFEVVCGFDYMAIDWPVVDMVRQFGIYTYNQPVMRVGFCMGYMQNVGV